MFLEGIRLPRNTAVGIHSLPEAEELRNPSWQASPYHEGISSMTSEGGIYGGYSGKFHSLPVAEEPSGTAVDASCARGPQGSADSHEDFGDDCRRRNIPFIARWDPEVQPSELLRDLGSSPHHGEIGHFLDMTEKVVNDELREFGL